MNLVELGYEPESEFCKGCMFPEISPKGAYCPYPKYLSLGRNSARVNRSIEGYERLPACLKDEQAAKQMIPRAEVGRMIYSIESDSMDETYDEGFFASLKKLEELLNQTKERDE